MKIKKINAAILGVITISEVIFGLSAIAADSIETFEKNIAKDKDNISKKIVEIKTQQAKTQRDIVQFGQTSNEVKGDQDRIKELRKDLVEPKVDLYKNSIQKKIEAGDALEDVASCE